MGKLEGVSIKRKPNGTEVFSVTSEYPQDDSSGYYFFDYCVDAGLQNCVVHCVLLSA